MGTYGLEPPGGSWGQWCVGLRLMTYRLRDLPMGFYMEPRINRHGVYHNSAFTSVGVVRQPVFALARASSILFDLAGFAGNLVDGIVVPVLRRTSDATRRLDSPLHGCRRPPGSPVKVGPRALPGVNRDGRSSCTAKRCYACSVGSTHGGRRLAQRPAQDRAAGFGNVAGGTLAGGLFELGGEAGPELQSVGVGETVERPDLRRDDAGPDVLNARHALQARDHVGEPRLPDGENDLPAQRDALAFDERHQVDVVGQCVARCLLEPVTARQQPALGAVAGALGAGQVGGVKDAGPGVLGAPDRARPAPPVPAEFAPVHQLCVGDEPGEAVAAAPCPRDLRRVVAVGLSPLTLAFA